MDISGNSETVTMRMRLIALLAMLAFTACATSAQESGRSGSQAGLYSQVGVASWYGGKFHGRKTASGEVYDQNRMTAAHRTLPFGTQVEVTNLRNGRSVVERINDRGPFIKGRIIDVSRRAAGKLGFRNQGIPRVRVRAIPTS